MYVNHRFITELDRGLRNRGAPRNKKDYLGIKVYLGYHCLTSMLMHKIITYIYDIFNNPPKNFGVLFSINGIYRKQCLKND